MDGVPIPSESRAGSLLAECSRCAAREAHDVDCGIQRSVKNVIESRHRPRRPRAYPYGIYDIGRNSGFVNVGTDHDTGAFAVASIRAWW